MSLSYEDRNSGTWARLKAMLEQELATQRARNDSPALGADQTAVTRGRIAQIKEILALGETPAPDESP